MAEPRAVSNKEAVVERALGLLLSLSGAGSGAVFRVVGKSLDLLVSQNLRQGGIDRTEAALSYNRPALAIGKAMTSAEYSVLPLSLDGRFVGVVYLEVPRARPDADLLRVCSIIANHLVGVGPRATEPDVAPAEREQLVLALDHCEWVISRVARFLGVSRRTVYVRMRRFDIERQIVRKISR